MPDSVISAWMGPERTASRGDHAIGTLCDVGPRVDFDRQSIRAASCESASSRASQRFSPVERQTKNICFKHVQLKYAKYKEKVGKSVSTAPKYVVTWICLKLKLINASVTAKTNLDYIRNNI